MALAQKVIRMDDHRSSGPQLEDGFVRIANELFDAVLSKLSSYRHTKIVLAIIRKTYGYGKKEDDITISQLAEITGIHRNNVGTALKELEEMNVIQPVRAGRHGLMIGINKHHTGWTSDDVKARGPGRKTIKLVADGSNQNDCDKQSKQLPEAIKTIEVSNQNVAHNRQPQKTTPKDNSKTHGASAPSVPEEFAQFWSLYPKREGSNSKADAMKAWNARIRSGVKAEDMLAGVKRYAAYCTTKGMVGTQYVKQASSFLGTGEHWTAEWGAEASKPAQQRNPAAFAGPML